MIAIHCRFVVDPSVRERFDESSCRQAAFCRTEPGNLAYEYLADICDPQIVVNYQLWESQEALDGHSRREGIEDRYQLLRELGVRTDEIMYFTVADTRLAGPYY
jgi:quinol monooxygenase YgiN